MPQGLTACRKILHKTLRVNIFTFPQNRAHEDCIALRNLVLSTPMASHLPSSLLHYLKTSPFLHTCFQVACFSSFQCQSCRSCGYTGGVGGRELRYWPTNSPVDFQFPPICVSLTCIPSRFWLCQCCLPPHVQWKYYHKTITYSAPPSEGKRYPCLFPHCLLCFILSSPSLHLSDFVTQIFMIPFW